jgi:arabinose-5-phosphate isomerase
MPDLSLARKVLQTEAAAVLALSDRLDERFARAVCIIRDCQGRVILTGMGKSGIVCRKIAATLSSTGTSALFLHPAEALHGDLGQPGTERTITATAPLSVTVGNAPEVKLSINGQGVALPATAPGQTLARFSVGPDGAVR